MENLPLKYLLVGLGLLVVLTIANIFITYKAKHTSKLLVRASYFIGIVLVIINGLRMLNDSYTMVAANVIVLASLIFSWIRTEKGERKAAKEE